MKLYSFQEKIVKDWLKIGKIGVIKSPKGLCKDKIKFVDRESGY